MKRETLFLKIAVFLIGIPVLALCVWVVPRVALGTAGHSPVLTIVALVTPMQRLSLILLLYLRQSNY